MYVCVRGTPWAGWGPLGHYSTDCESLTDVLSQEFGPDQG